MNKTAQRILSLTIVFGLVFGTSTPAMASPAFEPALQEANVYYVSMTGSDANPGTSEEPFRTFEKAISVLAPGDTLQVMPGTYYESMRLIVSGTAEAPINIIGNGAILNMRGVEQTGIRIKGSYLNLSNFEVIKATDAGIGVSGKYVTVSNNSVHNNVTENGANGICGKASSWSSGLKVGRGAARVTIEGNTVYYNCGEGIAVTRGVNVVVKNNTVYDNFAPNIYVDNSPYTKIYNNLVYCTGTVLRRDKTRPTGIGLGEEHYPGWGAQMHHVIVSSNRVRGCGKGIGVFASEVGGTYRNLTITNNTIPNGQARPIAVLSSPNKNIVISYNTMYAKPYIADRRGVTLIGNIISVNAGQ